MSTALPSTDVPFVAVVQHVKEATLVLHADLAFWQARLRGTGLHPYNAGGQAELALSATALAWQGSRTREFTLGLTVSRQPAGDRRDGLYLVHAFNSSRLFAFIERTFFQTPYYPAEITVAAGPPAPFTVGDARGSACQAAMAAARAPATVQDEDWRGPIYLGGTAARRYFIARLAGSTAVYPFLPGVDTLTLAPHPATPAFGWLVDSHAAGAEWRLRVDAVHARSRTFTEV